MESRSLALQGLGCILLALLLLATPAVDSVAAEAKHGFILIRGNRSSYIDVTLAKPVVLSSRPCLDCLFEGSTNGAFVGYAIHRLPKYKLIGGAVWARVLDPEGSDLRFIPRMGMPDRLQPGRYRFTLLSPPRTNAWERVEASVLIPTEGQGSMILEPTKKARVDILLQRDASAVPGQPVNALRGDVRVKQRTTVLMAGSLVSDYGQVAHVSACLLARASPSICEVEDQRSSSQVIAPGGEEIYVGAVRTYRAGKLAPGRYEAQFNMAVAGFGKRMGALVLAIH